MRLRLIFISTVLFSVVSYASSFTIDPIQVYLSTRTKTSLITLASQSDEVLRFQIQAFAWEQSPLGKIELSPTEDVVFHPVLLELKPNDKKNLRVGVTVPPGEVEKTYRIVITEMPRTRKKSETGSSLYMLSEMTVPVFVTPVAPEEHGEVAEINLEKNQLSFHVKNTGNVHFSVQKVNIVGLAQGNKKVFSDSQEGWYILSGGYRKYNFNISKENCLRLKSIEIEVLGPLQPIKSQHPISPGGCG